MQRHLTIFYDAPLAMTSIGLAVDVVRVEGLLDNVFFLSTTLQNAFLKSLLNAV